METLQTAVPDNVRSILQHAVQTLRTQVGPGHLSSEHLSEVIAIVTEEFHPVTLPDHRTAPAISLNFTQVVLGTLLRVAVEANIVVAKNGSDLCRRVAPGVTTLGMPTLQVHSLLRAFRYPSAAAYRRVQHLCTQIIEYIKVNRLAG
jgi:hypothetical protein